MVAFVPGCHSPAPGDNKEDSMIQSKVIRLCVGVMLSLLVLVGAPL